jgi:hypothetical protein
MTALSNAERTALYRLRHPEKVQAYYKTDHAKALRRDAVARWRARNPKLKKPLPTPLTTDELTEKRRRKKAAYMGEWKAKMNGFLPCFDFPPPPLDNRCFNCGEVAKLHMDHDHTTGKYRGYLCIQCNMGIGQLGDSVEGLEHALSYLKSTRGG